MRTPVFRIVVCAVAFGLMSLVYGQVAVHRVTFEAQKLVVQEKEGQHAIDYPGAMAWGEPGSPQLPALPYHWALPQGMAVRSLRVEVVESDTLAGVYSPMPAQAPEIYSKPQVTRIRSLGKAFLVADYPECAAQLIGQNALAGESMATVLVYPVQFSPQTGQLRFYREIDVVLELEPAPSVLKPAAATPAMRRLAKIQLGESIGGVESGASQPRLSSATLEAGNYSYIIITNETLVSTFQPLADWKTQKGVPAKIVTTAFIYQSYTGRDNQEKIRQFIRDAAATWGSEWILLGGDTNILPDRKVWAMDIWDFGAATADPDYNLPCDLYYADLDGDWNANGNDVWGEVDDNVDLIPDVFVGRAPVENGVEAEIFVDKVLQYEKSPDPEYLLNALFIGGILWSNPYTDGGVTKDYIDTMWMPDRYDPITKVYARDGNYWNPVAHDGAHLVNHINHASTGDMSGYASTSSIRYLPKGRQPGICFSVGCYPACIDEDCIAEQLINYEDGGLVAFIGNSRYGWGSPGNPNYGYSDLIDIAFYRALFSDELTHLGQAMASAKSRYAPFANAANVYRWCQFEVNLLGDPEMPVWTDRPSELAVDAPSELSAGGGIVSIGVTQAGQPLEGAKVCLMQEGGIYHSLVTGVDGFAGVQLDSLTSPDPITLTVTALNGLPYTAPIDVVHPEACLAARLGDDPAMEPRLRLDAGQDANLDLWLYNRGGAASDSATVTLRCADARIIVMDSLARTDGLAGGDSSSMAAAFRIASTENLPDRTVIPYQIVIESAGQQWVRDGAITAMRPVLGAVWRRSTDLGDGDGWFEPGESVEAVFCLQNSGLQDAVDVQWRLKQGDGLTGSTEWVELPELLAGDTTQCSLVLSIPRGQSVPVQVQPQLEFGESADETVVQTLAFPVGILGLADDVETDAVHWTREGNPDLWRVSTARQHSGRHAWRCAQERSPYYPINHPENTLTSPAFVLPQGAALSFWLWFEFPVYGSTGLYVEADQGQGWETLDYIGAGGALAALPNSQIWTRYAYDLSDIASGTEVRVRFRFISDDEAVSEGLYLDDILITGPLNRPAMASVVPCPPAVMATVIGEKHTLTLDWSADDNLNAIEQFDQEGYRFQGYRIYQLAEGVDVADYGQALALFDIDDALAVVKDRLRDPVTGAVSMAVRYSGSNTGAIQSYQVGRDWVGGTYFIKGQRYYFAVAAYAVQSDPLLYPRCVESPLQVVSAVFQEGYPGSAYGDTLTVEPEIGNAEAQVSPVVLDPALLTGHRYRLDFSEQESDAGLIWSLKDVDRDKKLIDNHLLVADEALDPIVDGMRIAVRQVDYFRSYPGKINYQLMGSLYIAVMDPVVLGNYNLGSQGGTDDIERLAQDYELRCTGVWETLDNGYTVVKEGMGSLVTLYNQWGSLIDHPLNPQYGISGEPFLVRVPFEIWNTTTNRQINAIMVDFSPPDSMRTIGSVAYLFLCDTPYEESVLDPGDTEIQEALTWVILVAEADPQPGDRVQITIENRFKPGDKYLIRTEALDPDLVQTGVESHPVEDFRLLQNYPNPFNQSTVLVLEGGQTCSAGAEVTIYDLLGRRVRRLTLPPNQRQVIWDGKNDSGHDLASGVYFYVVKAGKYKAAKKMLLIR